MRKIIIAIGALIAVTALSPATTALAVNHYWSMNASGCTPDNTPIQSNLYNVSSGAVQPAASNPSTAIDLNCPTKHNSGATNPTQLCISAYNDGTVYTLSGNYVGTFYRKNRSTGTLTSTGTVDMDADGNSGLDQFACGSTFSHTLDWNTYFYYVKVTVTPNVSTSGMSFRGIVLQS